jgi:deoxyribodipyrimidine photolyase-related protein
MGVAVAVAALIYPHQLYDNHPALDAVKQVLFVEDPLYFRQYDFHRQKLILHRASMKRYASALGSKFQVRYIDAKQLQNSGDIVTLLKVWNIQSIQLVDPCDDWLESRLRSACNSQGIRCTFLADTSFLTYRSVIQEYTTSRPKLFFTDFYIQQRKRLDILCDGEKPIGGKWSFDPENRKKLPKNVSVPPITTCREDEFVREAREYVRREFPNALGDDTAFRYPTSRIESQRWLQQFLDERLSSFGDYEDAISDKHEVLFHSVLTPMLNIGLLHPQEVIDAALSRQDSVPLNSLEGFVRQVIGWREFMRLVYITHGRKQRTQNSFGYTRKMPVAFYTCKTGIAPVDHVIKQLLSTGYCHHIERLMVLGNFMLLCEISPTAVYQWFMEFFIDSYDWVMVPNVYGMSQYADNGFMTTKPYVSGSSYILKMSNFAKGDWCKIWDALYWRFIDKHSELFARNPRMTMMVRMKDKLGSKLAEHKRVAEKFLATL